MKLLKYKGENMFKIVDEEKNKIEFAGTFSQAEKIMESFLIEKENKTRAEHEDELIAMDPENEEWFRDFVQMMKTFDLTIFFRTTDGKWVDMFNSLHADYYKGPVGNC